VAVKTSAGSFWRETDGKFLAKLTPAYTVQVDYLPAGNISRRFRYHNTQLILDAFSCTFLRISRATVIDFLFVLRTDAIVCRDFKRVLLFSCCVRIRCLTVKCGFFSLSAHTRTNVGRCFRLTTVNVSPFRSERRDFNFHGNPVKRIRSVSASESVFNCKRSGAHASETVRANASSFPRPACAL